MTDQTDGTDDEPQNVRPSPARPAGDKRGGRPAKPRPLIEGKARPTADVPRKSYPKSFDTEAPRAEGRPARPERSGAPSDRDRKPDGGRDGRAGRSTAPRETASDEPAGTMRIAKRLARAGIASRRDAEGMIADGRIKLNGRVLGTPAVTVTATDRIEVDNQALPAIERTRLWLFHKPAGLVTTNRDPEGRTTVFDRLPADMPRVLSVGRLDINTEGLLLLTNDGGLARILELPATGWLRRYRVRAHGAIKQAQLDELRQGIAIDGIFYGAIEATLDSEKGANVWLTLGLREGKNREVKRILSHLGLDVNRLIRVSFGPFQLGDLPDGAVREIKGRMLRDQLGERLIEEAGADFDAPIVNTFTNKVVEAEKPEADKPAKSEWVSATAERPNKRKFGDAKRVDALGRLDTRPGAKRSDDRGRGLGSQERGARSDRPDRARPPEKAYGAARAAPPAEAEGAPKRLGEGRRKANVWMAPGARPLGEKDAASREARAKRPDRPKPVFGKARTPRDGDAQARPPRAPARVGDRATATTDRDRAGARPRTPRTPTSGGARGGDEPRNRGGDGPKRGPRT